MISHSKRKWVAALYLLAIPSVDPQVAMYPMFPPPMHVAVPMPLPVPVAVPILIREEQDTTTTTTTSTTTERSRVAIAFPIAVPMPMQVPFAFPAFPAAVSCQSKNRPKNCPACPPCLCLPSCTPSFFSYCSPCHQKCRCRSKEDTPVPIPPRQPPPPVMGPAYGVAVPVPQMFGPPPIFVIPFPPPQPRRPSQPSRRSSYSSASDSYTDSSDDSSSSSSYERRSKRKKQIGYSKRRPSIRRRHFPSMEISDNELIQPVLTYINKNGDVKLTKRLSNYEAAELINDKPYRKIHVVSGNDELNMPRVLIESRNERKPTVAKDHRRRQVVLKNAAPHMLRSGNKQLVFRPPAGKMISNLSVSFNVAD